MEQLETMLRARTSDTLAKVKQKYRKIIEYLMIGLLLNTAISPFLHFLLGEDGPVFRITAGGMLSLIMLLLVGLATVFFYFRKYSDLETNVYDQNLKESIETRIQALKRSLSFEIRFIVLVFFIIAIISRLSSAYLGHGSFGDIFHADIIISLLLLMAIASFYIFLRVKHYRAYIRDLNEYLNELKMSKPE